MAKARAKFATPTRRLAHFHAHAAGVGAKTPLEYERRAAAFLAAPVHLHIHQKTRSNGDVIRYNDATEEFGVLTAAGAIRTYFRPDPAVHGYASNLDYFHAQ